MHSVGNRFRNALVVVKQTPYESYLQLKAQGKAPDQEFIHSTLGVSYLTLFVNDMSAAMARLKKAGRGRPDDEGKPARRSVYHPS